MSYSLKTVRLKVFTTFTFDCDFGLAELTASVIGGLTEVITSVMSGSWADFQTGCPIREGDPPAAG